MLLRSMTKYVNDQNWFAVALDFFIVVLGILLAFQITNWNEARSLRGQEAAILQNIAEDLRNDVLQLTDGIDFAIQNTQAANFALHAANRPVAKGINFVTDTDSTAGNPMVASWQDFDTTRTEQLWSLSVARYHPTQSNAAFASLMATGNLNLIRDLDFVAQLQRYQLRWRDIEVSQNTTFRPFRNHTVFVGQKFGLSVFSDMPEADFIELIRNNPELEAALRTLSEYSVLHYRQLFETRMIAQELLAHLENTTL